VMLQYVWMIKG